MNNPANPLVPFRNNGSIPDLSLSVQMDRVDNTLLVRYEISGDLSGIWIPLPGENPCRKTHLWEATCFEFFVAVKDSPLYWEFNLSPTGDWNVFPFKDYRNKNYDNLLEEEPLFQSLPFKAKKRSEHYFLKLDVNLEKIIKGDQALEIGVSNVIQTRNKDLSYWALRHIESGSEPDFHSRDTFSIKL